MEQVLITWKDVLNGCDEGIQVWISKQCMRNCPYQLFYSNRNNVLVARMEFYPIASSCFMKCIMICIKCNSLTFRALSNGKEAKVKVLESKVVDLNSCMVDINLDRGPSK
jgi:hypothetical protein